MRDFSAYPQKTMNACIGHECFAGGCDLQTRRRQSPCVCVRFMPYICLAGLRFSLKQIEIAVCARPVHDEATSDRRLAVIERKRRGQLVNSNASCLSASSCVPIGDTLWTHFPLSFSSRLWLSTSLGRFCAKHINSELFTLTYDSSFPHFNFILHLFDV